MMQGKYELHHGDCLEVMTEIEDGSVDAIIADIPYGTTACKWDSVIPFEPMWAQLKRIIKPRGAIVLFGSQPFTSALVMSNTEWFKYDHIWQKTLISGFLDANRRPLLDHEIVSVFCSGQATYNPQKALGKLHTNGTSERKNWPSHYGDFSATTTTTTEFFPKRIIQFSNPRTKGQHPTQKPTDLMAYLIRTYTNEGETVLDFTMGSGTTGVACAMTGREFVGIEQDAEYFDIAKGRIEFAYNGYKEGASVSDKPSQAFLFAPA